MTIFKKSMVTLPQYQIDKLLLMLEPEKNCSDLGFFSKPFRISYSGEELVVKLYHPVRDLSLVSSIIENHDLYMAALTATGIKIPQTAITCRQLKGKQQLIIIQEAFHEKELMRKLVKEASVDRLETLCRLIFDDILKFWTGKSPSLKMGFHPTLRNYAVRNSELYYFDTFPPMLMEQRELNRIMVTMAPFRTLIKYILPSRAINIVSDEYYAPDRMFTGVVGSCCRLRPEAAHQILSFSIRYLENSLLFSGKEKGRLTRLLQKPPDLSKLWLSVRKLTGNIGEPNIVFKARHLLL